MDTFTAPLSAALSSMFPKSPFTTGRGELALPVDGEKTLDSEDGHLEKCDLRIEGMTCGACVEVRWRRITIHPFHRRLTYEIAL